MKVHGNRKHYYWGKPLYNSWRGMKQRCYCISQYKDNYQGKNIKVYEPWHEFIVFKEWSLKNGYKKGLTIERLDINKDYSPENCEWITKSENSRRRNLGYDYSKRNRNPKDRFIILNNGNEVSVREYAENNDLNYNTFRGKLARNKFPKKVYEESLERIL